MAENSSIEWTDHTFNPWRGCTKVAAGCQIRGIWGPNGTRVVAADWEEPLKWDRKAHAAGKRHRVFCASLADVFEDWPGQVADHNGNLLFYSQHDPVGGLGGRLFREHCVPVNKSGTLLADPHDSFLPTTLDALRADLFDLIDRTPQLDWLLLTKRPENIRRMWPSYQSDLKGNRDYTPAIVGGMRCGLNMPNVWLGTSIATQEDAEKNVPELLKCRDLAAKLFLSIEPLVGPVDLEIPWEGEPTLPTVQADWVIIGGESKQGGVRPCNVAWIRALVQQCQAAGVPCFVKQLGSMPIAPEETVEDYRSKTAAIHQFPEGVRFGNRTKDAALNGRCIFLKHPKGGDPNEWPADLRVREFPN